MDERARHPVAPSQHPCERRIAYLAACAGPRCTELRLLNFAHEGWILISAEMAKGSRERWIPVMVDLEPVICDIRALGPARRGRRSAGLPAPPAVPPVIGVG